MGKALRPTVNSEHPTPIYANSTLIPFFILPTLPSTPPDYTSRLHGEAFYSGQELKDLEEAHRVTGEMCKLYMDSAQAQDQTRSPALR